MIHSEQTSRNPWKAPRSDSRLNSGKVRLRLAAEPKLSASSSELVNSRYKNWRDLRRELIARMVLGSEVSGMCHDKVCRDLDVYDKRASAIAAHDVEASGQLPVIAIVSMLGKYRMIYTRRFDASSLTIPNPPREIRSVHHPKVGSRSKVEHIFCNSYGLILRPTCRGILDRSFQFLQVVERIA
jgi:hypothetical protein